MMKIRQCLLALAFAWPAFVFAQNCTPDPNASGLLYPTPGNIEVLVNQANQKLITVTAPSDSTFTPTGSPFSINASIDSIVLLTMRGLPTGVSYSCEPAKCVWLGGATGCLSVEGTPVQPGVYPIEADLVIHYTAPIIGSGTFPYTETRYVVYVVDVISGLAELKLNSNAVFPNPSQGIIRFNEPVSKLNVYDLNGRLLHAESAQQGQEFDLSSLSKGMYILTYLHNEIAHNTRLIIE